MRKFQLDLLYRDGSYGIWFTEAENMWGAINRFWDSCLTLEKRDIAEFTVKEEVDTVR